MAARPKTEVSSAGADTLQAILKQLEVLNRHVAAIAERLPAGGGGDRGAELAATRDPGDAVPEGVAPTAPVPLTGDDKKAKAALERLPARRRRAAKAD